MNDILLREEMPQSWKQACITLIPKDDTDMTNMKNYRPISLLNLDYKAKILANRLKVFLVDYIKEEQPGFIPQRHLKDNIRTVLNVIEYYEKHTEKSVELVFLDAEKAFDNLNWKFMLLILEKMKIGEKFLNAVESIYEEQEASLVITLDPTKSFLVKKGVRQGCPLSPLLFILVLEILLPKITNTEEIRGLEIKKSVISIERLPTTLCL